MVLLLVWITGLLICLAIVAELCKVNFDVFLTSGGDSYMLNCPEYLDD